MPKLNHKKETKEEFELKEVSLGTQKSPTTTETNLEEQVCQNYWLTPKYKRSLNEPRKPWRKSRTQKFKASSTETSSQLNDTTYVYLRTHCISKKSWLLLQRITLILLASSLVLVANIGTVIIYLKDDTETIHLGSEKFSGRAKAFNSSLQNISTPIVNNNVPDMNAHNLSESKAINSKSLKVGNFLGFYCFPYI